MKKLILVLFIVSFGLTSCEKNDPVNPTLLSENDQTVLIYMPWSTNLVSYFQTNIADFEQAIKNGILKNERILVFLSISPTESTLFELKYEKEKNTRTTLKEYSNPAFISVDGITSILNDVKSFAPANRYAMIIGCHGMGWLPVSSQSSRSLGQKDYWEYEGVPLTRYFGGLTSEYQTDVTTLADAIINAGIKMEYILFDDCYMSSIEVAFDLKEATDYLIASPTEVMIYGFPYAIIGQYLVGNVDYQGICDGFHSFYENYSLMPCGTIGVTKCSELDNLTYVMKEINQRYTLDPYLLNDIQRLDGYSPVIFFDYGDYVSKLCPDRDLSAKFMNQLERTVPLRKHTSSYYSMSRGQMQINAYSGVTISDPSINPKAVQKMETEWYKATH